MKERKEKENERKMKQERKTGNIINVIACRM